MLYKEFERNVPIVKKGLEKSMHFIPYRTGSLLSAGRIGPFNASS